MTIDQTAHFLLNDPLQKRHIRYRLSNNHNHHNRSLSMTNMTNVPTVSESPAVIVAYQDVTAESSVLLGHSEVDLAIRPEMEESFCSNFVCCGQYLPDLHALLQHYEDCHVRFEASQPGDSVDDYGKQQSAMHNNGQAGNGNNNMMPSTDDQSAGVFKRSPRLGKRRRMLAVELEQCDFLTDDTNVVSAFDNTVLRTITTPVDQAYHGAMLRRSQSVPAGINYSRLPNLSGTPSDSPIDQYRFIHSILSATVDNPEHGQSGYLNSHDGRPYSSVSSSSITGNSSNGPQSRPDPLSSSFTSSSLHHQHYLSAFDKGDRPYVCPVPGCGKAYKNPNGLKYHEKHGHDSAAENVERPHRCSVSGCGKRYKNPNGLKYHMAHAHPNFVRHLSSGGIGMMSTSSSSSSSAQTRYTPSGLSSSVQMSSFVPAAPSLTSSTAPPPLHRKL